MNIEQRLSELKKMIAIYESLIKPYTLKDALSSKQSTHERLKYYERVLKRYHGKESLTKKERETLEKEYGYSEIELRESENKLLSAKRSFESQWFKKA